jgi:hypothetical protein
VARQDWFNLCSPLNLGDFVPRQECNFADWWRSYEKSEKEFRKWVNSLIILGGQMIWKHGNSYVFEGLSPSVNIIMREPHGWAPLVFGRCQEIRWEFYLYAIKKMVLTCVPLKKFLAPVCHCPKLLCPLCHSVQFCK